MRGLIRRLILAALGDMPKHAGRIINVAYAQSPGLHGRGLWLSSPEHLWLIQRLDMLPPRVEIVDHHLHHAVFRPFFL
jgi:hypothetical protein